MITFGHDITCPCISTVEVREELMTVSQTHKTTDALNLGIIIILPPPIIIIIIANIYHVLFHTRHCAEPCITIISFTPHNNLVSSVLLIDTRKRCPEKIRYVRKMTQWQVAAEVWTRACLTAELCSQ